MNSVTKYTIIIFGSFLAFSSIFMYLMLSDNWEYFVKVTKWFKISLFIHYLFNCNGKKDLIKNNI